MELRETMKRAREAVSVGQVIGQPVERDGITVIPAATVFGGGGGGGGTGPAQDGTTSKDAAATSEGSGFGFGLGAWPAGAFEIKGERVRWEPAIDYTRIALAVLLFAYLVLRARHD